MKIISQDSVTLSALWSRLIRTYLQQGIDLPDSTLINKKIPSDRMRIIEKLLGDPEASRVKLESQSFCDLVDSGVLDEYTILFDTFVAFYDPYSIELAKIMEYLPNNQSKRLLEIGCGTGRLSFALANFENNHSIVAIDTDPRVIDFCIRKATFNKNSRIRFLNCEVDDLHSLDHFDACILSWVLFTMPPQFKKGLFDKLSSQLKSGALLIIVEPGPESEYGNLVFDYAEDWHKTLVPFYKVSADSLEDRFGKPFICEEAVKIPYIFPSVDEALMWLRFSIEYWHNGSVPDSAINSLKKEVGNYNHDGYVRFSEFVDILIFRVL